VIDEQVLLLPPSVRDWLPDDHLALFVIDAAAQLDLEQPGARSRDDRALPPAA